MHVSQNEKRKYSQVSYPQTRSASVDSGFGDINKTSDDIHAALSAITKGKRKFEKWQKKSSVDIRNIRDEEGNNILHLIARLKKKQKRSSLNVLVEKISKEDLTQLVNNNQNRDGKTPLQVALIDKIKKGKHGSYTIQDNDNSLKFLVALLKHGAKPDQLELEKLQGLDEKQRTYYHKFLKKIVRSVKKSELDQEKKNSVIIKAAEIIYDGYPLHRTVLENDKDKFSELLQSGYDITNQNKDGNNVLHLITELGKKQKINFFNIVLNASKEEGKEQLKAQLKRAINAENTAKQTPLHQVLQRIEEKSKESSLTNKVKDKVKKEFKDTGRYKVLNLLLENGADISKKDSKGNNALHYITSLKKEQKVVCLDLILDLVKLPKEKLSEAVNATNEKGQTPLQKLLFSKVTKEEHSSESIPGKVVKIFKRPFTKYDDNTIESAIRLFELGAKVNDLQLSELQNLGEEYREYYHKFLKRLVKSVKESELDQEKKNSVIIKAAEITDDGYPLHKAVSDKNIDKFNELLQSGYDITTKDAEKNTVLHYAVRLDKGAKYDFTKLILEKNRGVINIANKDGNTPLHQLLQYIKEKGENRSCTDRNFKKTNRYKTLELLLRNGADITAKDGNENNALHYIASLKGGQKVVCLNLVLDLVERKVISKEKFSEAVNATNKEKRTPLQVALIKKAEKGKHLSQVGTTFDPAVNDDNTTKFCAMLLQNGAHPDCLDLKDEKFHTDSYYLVLRDLKNYQKLLQEGREKAKELKEQLEEKYHCKTASKKCKSVIKNTGSGIKKGASATGKALSAFGKYMDPASRTRELLAITVTVTVIAIAAFAFFQGQVGIGAAIPIIAVAGVICLTLTLGFSGIKKLFGNSADKMKNFVDSDQQNLGNDSEDLAAKRQQNRLKGTENPSSKMQDTSAERHDKSCGVTVSV